VVGEKGGRGGHGVIRGVKRAPGCQDLIKNDSIVPKQLARVGNIQCWVGTGRSFERQCVDASWGAGGVSRALRPTKLAPK
jgi:hypothetical protein